MTFSQRQNFRDRKQISSFLVLRVGRRVDYKRHGKHLRGDRTVLYFDCGGGGYITV